MDDQSPSQSEISIQDLRDSLVYTFTNRLQLNEFEIIKRNPLSFDDFERLKNQISELKRITINNYDEQTEIDNFVNKTIEELSTLYRDDMFTLQICKFIEYSFLHQSKISSRPFSILLHGHPSSGKSTAMQYISKNLKKYLSVNEKILPIYSEFQLSIEDDDIDEDFIWARIINGVNNHTFKSMDCSKDIASFTRFCTENQYVPLIFVDTVDVLFSHEKYSEQNVKQWLSFLELASNKSINIIFSSRSSEWESNVGSFRDKITQISLPELMLQQINSYVVDNDLKYSEQFEQFSRVLQSILPITIANKRVNFFKLGPEELKDYISHNNYDNNDKTSVELTDTLENRLSAIELEKRIIRDSNYYEHYILKLYEWFVDKIEGDPKRFQNCLRFKDLVKLSPVNIYYEYSWARWSNICNNFQEPLLLKFKELFLRTIVEKSYKGNDKTLTKLYIDIDELVSSISEYESKDCSLNKNQIYTLINRLSKTGLITNKTGTITFSHQLFHSLSILKYGNVDQTAKLDHFSFLDNEIDSKSDDYLRMIGYCLTWVVNKENDTLVELYRGKIRRFYPRALYNIAEEQDEEQEDKLLRFFDSERKVQFVTGPAGTGKSRYALKFLSHQIKYRKQSNSRYLYVTKNPQLAEKMRSEWNRSDSFSKETSNPFDLSYKHVHEYNADVDFLSTSDLLSKHAGNPKNCMWFDGKNGFKKQYEKFSKTNAIEYDSNTQKSSAVSAWLEFKQALFTSKGKQRYKSLDEYLNDKEKKSYFNQRMRKLIWKFAHYDFNSEAEFNSIQNVPYTYLARNALENLNKGIRKDIFYDVVVIDEIQDLDAAIVSFIIALINPKDNNKQLNKSILFTGDEEQTVNYSGFSWKKFINTIVEIISESNIQNHVAEEFKKERQRILRIDRLKLTWRTPPEITAFNRTAFRTFRQSKEVGDTILPEEHFENLMFMIPKRKTFPKSRIAIIESEDIGQSIIDLQSLIYLNNRNRIYFKDPYIVYPNNLDPIQVYDSYSEDEFQSSLKLKINSAANVKGLESEVVIVIHPYELHISDIISREKQSKDITHKDLEKLYNKDKLVQELLLFQKYAMNVLYTRTKSLLIIILPKQDGLSSNGIAKIGDNVRLGLPTIFDNKDNLRNFNELEFWDINNLQPDVITDLIPSGIKENEDYWFRQLLYSINNESEENLAKSVVMYYENVNQNNLNPVAQVITGLTKNSIIDGMKPLCRLSEENKKIILEKAKNKITYHDQFTEELRKVTDSCSSLFYQTQKGELDLFGQQIKHKIFDYGEDSIKIESIHNSSLINLISNLEDFLFETIFGDIINNPSEEPIIGRLVNHYVLEGIDGSASSDFLSSYRQNLSNLQNLFEYYSSNKKPTGKGFSDSNETFEDFNKIIQSMLLFTNNYGYTNLEQLIDSLPNYRTDVVRLTDAFKISLIFVNKMINSNPFDQSDNKTQDDSFSDYYLQADKSDMNVFNIASLISKSSHINDENNFASQLLKEIQYPNSNIDSNTITNMINENEYSPQITDILKQSRNSYRTKFLSKILIPDLCRISQLKLGQIKKAEGLTLYPALLETVNSLMARNNFSPDDAKLIDLLLGINTWNRNTGSGFVSKFSQINNYFWKKFMQQYNIERQNFKIVYNSYIRPTCSLLRTYHTKSKNSARYIEEAINKLLLFFSNPKISRDAIPSKGNWNDGSLEELLPFIERSRKLKGTLSRVLLNTTVDRNSTLKYGPVYQYLKKVGDGDIEKQELWIKDWFEKISLDDSEWSKVLDFVANSRFRKNYYAYYHNMLSQTKKLLPPNVVKLFARTVMLPNDLNAKFLHNIVKRNHKIERKWSIINANDWAIRQRRLTILDARIDQYFLSLLEIRQAEQDTFSELANAVILNSPEYKGVILRLAYDQIGLKVSQNIRAYMESISQLNGKQMKYFNDQLNKYQHRIEKDMFEFDLKFRAILSSGLFFQSSYHLKSEQRISQSIIKYSNNVYSGLTMSSKQVFTRFLDSKLQDIIRKMVTKEAFDYIKDGRGFKYNYNSEKNQNELIYDTLPQSYRNRAALGEIISGFSIIDLFHLRHSESLESSFIEFLAAVNGYVSLSTLEKLIVGSQDFEDISWQILLAESPLLESVELKNSKYIRADKLREMIDYFSNPDIAYSRDVLKSVFDANNNDIKRLEQLILHPLRYNLKRTMLSKSKNLIEFINNSDKKEFTVEDLLGSIGMEKGKNREIIFEVFQGVFVGMKFVDKSGRQVQISRYVTFNQDYSNFEIVMKIEAASENPFVVIDLTRYRGYYGEKSPRIYKDAMDIAEFYDRKRIFEKIDTISVSEMIDSDIDEQFSDEKMAFIELQELVDRIGANFTLPRSAYQSTAPNVIKAIILERAVDKELGIVQEVNNGDLYLISHYHARSVRHWKPGKLISVNLLNDFGIWVEKSRR